MTTKAGNIGFFLFDRSRKGSFRLAGAAVAVIILLMLYVAGKVTIVKLGYEINTLERQKEELERENRSLRIEAASLSSPARIEELATKRLGMVRPPKENIVVVKRRESGEKASRRK